jgi:hypothetical protein
MSTGRPTVTEYHGDRPLICWPIYWQALAAKRAKLPWWAVMAAKVRERLTINGKGRHET